MDLALPEDHLLLLFSPKDFKDADLEHIPFDGNPLIERSEYVTDPVICMMLVRTRVDNVAAFIGATLFRDCFKVSKKGMEYGNKAWEHECWHWNVLSKGKELKRDKKIKNIKPSTQVRQDGQVINGRVLVLQRDAKYVERFGEEFVVKWM